MRVRARPPVQKTTTKNMIAVSTQPCQTHLQKNDVLRNFLKCSGHLVQKNTRNRITVVNAQPCLTPLHVLLSLIACVLKLLSYNKNKTNRAELAVLSNLEMMNLI